MNGQDERASFGNSDAPTPPVGLPMGAADDATPPEGIENLSGAVSPDDYGKPSPAVLGGDAPQAEGPGEAGEWPTLEYRSRNKPESGSGALGWLRRRRGTE